jgi:N-acetylmuramoyl-L-alanine amidase
MDTFRADVLDGLGLRRFYRVQVGAFRDKVNAEKMLAEVKMAGFKNAFIKFE